MESLSVRGHLFARVIVAVIEKRGTLKPVFVIVS
jgi:hypothetical protein